MLNEDNEEPQAVLAAAEHVRNIALRMFASHINIGSDGGPPITVDGLARATKFLSINETIIILREHYSAPDLDADTAEFNKKLSQVLAALMLRIESNVMQYSVNLGFMDCAFDDDANAFTFTTSKKGEAALRAHMTFDDDKPDT